MMRQEVVIIGTRTSRLAMWQAEQVRRLLAERGLAAELRGLVTAGDRSQRSGIPLPAAGGKGLFTEELEAALSSGEIHAAVHSLKDLPTAQSQGFVIAAACARGPAEDVLVSREGQPLSALPQGARVGTSSLRRALQLIALRPDLRPVSIRGNVETRVRKVIDEGCFDAVVLAAAGLSRLGLEGHITQRFTEDEMLPAPGQGAIAVQCCGADAALVAALKTIECPATRHEVEAERAFLRALEAGCSAPVAARAHCAAGRLRFRGRCLHPSNGSIIEVRGEDAAEAALLLGERMAAAAAAKGFIAADWRGSAEILSNDD